MSLLAAADWADFKFIRDSIGLSDSALSKQLTTLEEAGYVEIGKGFVGKRPRTSARLTTVGRKSGQERSVIIGYLEDGPNLVVLAMNGWDEGHPSWWLNLEAHPDAIVRLARQHPRPVRARPSVGEERDRLWQRWVAVDPKLDAYAGRRSTETPVIVLEPRDGTA